MNIDSSNNSVINEYEINRILDIYNNNFSYLENEKKIKKKKLLINDLILKYIYSNTSTTSININNNSILTYENYLNRLYTFHSNSWFAKPNIISPLICSKFGYVNSNKNVIKCEFCNNSIEHNGKYLLFYKFIN